MDEKEYTVTNIRKTAQDSASETYQVKIKRKVYRSERKEVPVSHKWDSVITYGFLTVLFTWLYIDFCPFRLVSLEVFGFVWLLYWFALMRISFLEEKQSDFPYKERTSYDKLKTTINFLFMVYCIVFFVSTFF